MTEQTIVHVYVAGHQEAVSYTDNCTGKPFTITHKPGQRIYAACCHQRRPAKNLTVQVYYDCVAFWCKPNRGCQRITPKHRRVARLRSEGITYKVIAWTTNIQPREGRRLMREYWKITERTNRWNQAAEAKNSGGSSIPANTTLGGSRTSAATPA